MHFHVDLVHFALFESLAHKTVTTLHGRLDLKDLPAVYSRWPQFGLVSVSDAQRKSLPNGKWLATIGHGLPPGLHTFCDSADRSYLAFLGRISPEKRPDVAIGLARRSGVALKIAAKVDPADAAYFTSVVKPLLTDPLVDFVGEIDDDRKSEFLSGAAALLFPIDWPEPFGLVVIEAMACGTPVIAWNRGSVPEIVEHGVTGYIVDSEEEALEAIARVHTLDRSRVRLAFEQRFSATTMAQRYVSVYRKLLGATQLAVAS